MCPVMVYITYKGIHPPAGPAVPNEAKYASYCEISACESFDREMNTNIAYASIHRSRSILTIHT